MSFSDWVSSIKDVLGSLAIIAGGAWALYRFGLFREKYPSMEIENGIILIGENPTEYLLELYCFVENKGKVRKWLTPFQFDLLDLEHNSPFARDPELNYEVKFNKRLKKIFWVLPTWHIPFVDGQSEKKFHYLTVVPKSVQYLSLYTKFIDFKSKKRAVNYILSEKKIKMDVEVWSKKTWDEKVRFLSLQKTDFYFSQTTISVDKLIQNRAKIML